MGNTLLNRILKAFALSIKYRKSENTGQPSLRMQEEKKKSFSLMWAVAWLYLLLRADTVSKIHTAQIQQNKTGIANHSPLDFSMVPTVWKGTPKISTSGSPEYSNCPSHKKTSAETFDFQSFTTSIMKVWCPAICEAVDPALRMMKAVFICLYPERGM